MARLAILDGYSWQDAINNKWLEEAQNNVRSLIVDKGVDITAQPIYSEHEYTLISKANETVFAEDETGAPQVFTIEEWNAINGKKNDGTVLIFLASIAIVAGIMIFKGV